MSAYLDDNPSCFAKITLGNVITFLQVLTQSSLREEQHVRRRYTDHASDFDRILTFLTALDVVQRKGSQLQLIFSTATDRDGITPVIVSQMLHTNGPHHTEIGTYLRQFAVQGGTPIYRPSPSDRGRYSDLRNFLLECAVIVYDAGLDRYILQPPYYSLYATSCATSPVEPDEVDRLRNSQSDIGLIAERAVVHYERTRVGSTLESNVKHIALHNAAAGYDVESVSILDDACLQPRLIEVKAVSPADLCFFWSANEMATARLFGSWYHLYLVPMAAGGVPLTENLRIVSDPIANLLGSPEDWRIEPSSVRCTSLHVV